MINSALKILVTFLLFGFMVSYGAESSAVDFAEQVKTCNVCHGKNGISKNTNWPNLAGQKNTYLSDQLRAFRNGQRVDPLMSGAAAQLSDQEIDLLSSYFSTLSPTLVQAKAQSNKAGENRRAQCISCHGMRGITVNAQWPNISGQQKGYLQKQLIAFRDGTRQSEVMKVIVKDLSDQQISDVSDYYSQQALR